MRLYRYIKRNSKKFDGEVAYLTISPKFESIVNRVRNLWDISEYADKDQRMDELLWSESFDKMITLIIKSSNLTEKWRDWLYRYIIYDNKSGAFDPRAAIIMQKKKTFAIEVSPATTLAEVGRAFKVIKKEQSSSERQRPAKFLARNELIFRLARSGTPILKIKEHLKKKGYKVSQGNIKTIVSRVNKITGNKVKLRTI